MISVPTSSFLMGDPFSAGNPDEGPIHTVTLSAYEIGTYEVTNGEFAEMLNWALSQGILTTASTATVVAHGQELLDINHNACLIDFIDDEFVPDERDGFSMANHPVVKMSWYGAVLFCNWLSHVHGLELCYDPTDWTWDLSKNGFHLPTEAQWERAAAWDGSQHYRYATSSNSISENDANYSNDNPLNLNLWPHTTPVGYYEGVTSPVGCFDMSGNADELCNEWWASAAYLSHPPTDPPGPSTGSRRVKRGGNWRIAEFRVRSAYRTSTPSGSRDDLGFRLAK
jgi:formylglycine-generating enzyme required for sulfatase activity